ncbi:hypothetical protein Q4Q34_07640 [Flavivirga abyssicola]|uniref:hypothetical protein n=1 Tax=Flavivirga abyssicola TaxID=3063533 RepID=UPI0026DEE11F|nr:hypothetical protein [Flavivirga sp. MEBiC07777]WVK14899.1 hypothetical protein Q4Q34_07640 [Flavivirga sp. MEBiC07777]
MTILIIEGGNYLGLFLLVLAIMFLPPLILLIIGLAIRSKNRKTSKILMILAVVYLLISLGICGSMMI